VTTVRIFSAYGPWEEPGRLVPYVLGCCLRGDSPRVTAGWQPRDFIYIDDVLALLELAADCPQARGQILHAGTGRQHRVRDMVETILRVASGGRVAAQFGAERARPDEPASWVASIDRTTALTGWRPRFDLLAGVEHTWAWFTQAVTQKTRKYVLGNGTAFAKGDSVRSSQAWLNGSAKPQAAERPRKMLSLIMPARNEEGNLPRAYAEVTAVLAGLPYAYEVLIIDNDSTDRTGEVAAELCARDPRWRYARFSRNFQVEASITAGLRLARGDAAMVLFSDLQDPPELIPEFLGKWEEGYDVVYGVVRQRQGDPFWRASAARLVYRLINALSDVEITPNATDFRLLSRRAIDALNQFDERNRYLRGFAHWIGFKRCAIPYDRRARTAGRSKAPLAYLLNFASNALTCFSIKPLQLFSWMGLLALTATLALALVYLGYYLTASPLPGWTTTYLLLLANLSVLLLGFGTLGEYIGRIYVETKRRPLFLIDHTINLEDPADQPEPLPGPTWLKHLHRGPHGNGSKAVPAATIEGGGDEAL
jgi:dolichol-phosphate mannosyltransferase